MTCVDLNSDLGEGYGIYTRCDDIALLDVITSANVACGLHAGDPEIMGKTFAEARARGVAVGAHPGFPDLWGFGRRRMHFTPAEIERLVAYQIGAAQALASYANHRITYVKAHGALATMASRDKSVASAIARAIRSVDRDLALLAIALTAQGPAGESCGIKVYNEIFADRGYADDGYLLSRDKPGALITDGKFSSERILQMLDAGGIITSTGSILPCDIHSICVHGDTPNAVDIAYSVRIGLEKAGVQLAACATNLHL